MAKYRYTGPGPIEVPADGGGLGLVRPGDVWEFSEEPSWGLWELLDPQGAEKPSEAAGDPPVSPPASAPETTGADESAPSSTEEA